MEYKCPICNNKSELYTNIENIDYFNCRSCDFIFIDLEFISKIDNGNSVVEYTENYWNNELKSAKKRAYDDVVGRMTELIYYAKRPIQTMVDIGTGPGYILDFVDENMQNLSKILFGIEKYPPPKDLRTKSSNYFIGEIKDFNKKIDAGFCIEVIEHLTPKMYENLLSQLQAKANPNSIYLFNTGLSIMVKNGHNDYLDPLHRGHIVSWSLKALEIIGKKYGFVVREIRGKNFAFCLEYMPINLNINEDITNRVWSPLKENLTLLESENLGSLLKTFGRSQVREFL